MAKRAASSDQIVGSHLRLRRKQLSLTEEGLAEILGVSVCEIEKYESGAARLGPERLGSASKALAAPMAYFFSGLDAVESSKPVLPPSQSLLITPGAADLVSAYSRIASPQVRDAVLKLVLHLAREGRGCVSPTLEKTPPQARRSSLRGC